MNLTEFTSFQKQGNALPVIWV